MQLFSVQIGEKTAMRDTGAGPEPVHAAPLLLLHLRRVVTVADPALSRRLLSGLTPRFPDARLLKFPGGPEDSLVADAARIEEVLVAYGLGPAVAPDTPAGLAIQAWTAAVGPPSPLPAALESARDDGALLPALLQQLPRGTVHPPRVFAVVGALATPAALDFLCWAIAGENDFEFQAKFGFFGRDPVVGVEALPDEAAEPFARRVIWGGEHAYHWDVVEACVRRLTRLGARGDRALAEMSSGHRLERQLRRWAARHRLQPGCEGE